MTFSANLEADLARVRATLEIWQRAAMELSVALQGLTLTAECVQDEVQDRRRAEWLAQDVATARKVLERYDAHKTEISNLAFKAVLRSVK